MQNQMDNAAATAVDRDIQKLLGRSDHPRDLDARPVAQTVDAYAPKPPAKQIDVARDPIEQIALWTEFLTYGEMIEYAAGLAKHFPNPPVALTDQDIAKALHSWVKERRSV